MKQVILAEHKDHIKNYGFLSDLYGETSYGVNKSIIQKYEDMGYVIETEFIEDPFLGYYHPFNGTWGGKIALGTLVVKAVMYELNYQI